VAGNVITEYVFAFCAIRATYTELNLVGARDGSPDWRKRRDLSSVGGGESSCEALHA